MATKPPSAPPPPKPVAFADLWKHYPSSDPCVNTSTGAKAYDNQCAIRVGMALERCGVSFASFRGPRCEFGPHGNGMVLRAEELANWLKTRPFAGCPVAEPGPGKEFQSRLKGRTGIVFFKDYWRRAGEKYPTGDHIDLWNRDRLTPSFETFARFSLGISRMPSLNPFARAGENWWSDLENSRTVTFWTIA
jgi:hypothetical protein